VRAFIINLGVPDAIVPHLVLDAVPEIEVPAILATLGERVELGVTVIERVGMLLRDYGDGAKADASASKVAELCSQSK